MGTNFYMVKQTEDDFSTLEGELKKLSFTEEQIEKVIIRAKRNQEIHIAKTSCGWVPLFQEHKGKWSSVKEIEMFYNVNQLNYDIKDEYGTVYTWEDFKERVIDFNPDGLSHMEYHRGISGKLCDNKGRFKDSEGFEFTEYEFF